MKHSIRSTIIIWALPVLYLVLVVIAFIDRAQCTGGFINLCDIGIVLLSIPWIYIFDSSISLSQNGLPFYSSMVLNFITLYGIGRILYIIIHTIAQHIKKGAFGSSRGSH